MRISGLSVVTLPVGGVTPVPRVVVLPPNGNTGVVPPWIRVPRGVPRSFGVG